MIAAGKNTVATLLADRFIDAGRAVVIADIDDVAMMVGAPGAGATGLWFAAHQAHAALVGWWMRSDAHVLISVGPIYTQAEHDDLTFDSGDMTASRSRCRSTRRLG